MPLNYFQLTIGPTILGKHGYAGFLGSIALLPLQQTYFRHSHNEILL